MDLKGNLFETQDDLMRRDILFLVIRLTAWINLMVVMFMDRESLYLCLTPKDTNKATKGKLYPPLMKKDVTIHIRDAKDLQF